MRCRECEEPIDVLDICEACEARAQTIEPVPIRLCQRGHFMTRARGWRCDVCRRMRNTMYKAAARDKSPRKEVKGNEGKCPQGHDKVLRSNIWRCNECQRLRSQRKRAGIEATP